MLHQDSRVFAVDNLTSYVKTRGQIYHGHHSI